MHHDPIQGNSRSFSWNLPREKIEKALAPEKGKKRRPSSQSNPPQKLLVISSRVQESEKILQSVKEDVITLQYDWETTSLLDLLRKIKRAARNASLDSIAFMNHGEEGEFFLNEKNATSTSTLSERAQKRFWKGIGSLLGKEGRIDLLACSLAESAQGMQLVNELEKLTKRNVAASTDKTGDAALLGDWLLETDGIDLSTLYFQDKPLDWKHTLASEPYDYLKTIDFEEEEVVLPELIDRNPVTHSLTVNDQEQTAPLPNNASIFFTSYENAEIDGEEISQLHINAVENNEMTDDNLNYVFQLTNNNAEQIGEIKITPDADRGGTGILREWETTFDYLSPGFTGGLKGDFEWMIKEQNAHLPIFSLQFSENGIALEAEDGDLFNVTYSKSVVDPETGEQLRQLEHDGDVGDEYNDDNRDDNMEYKLYRKRSELQRTLTHNDIFTYFPNDVEEASFKNQLFNEMVNINHFYDLDSTIIYSTGDSALQEFLEKTFLSPANTDKSLRNLDSTNVKIAYNRDTAKLDVNFSNALISVLSSEYMYREENGAWSIVKREDNENGIDEADQDFDKAINLFGGESISLFSFFTDKTFGENIEYSLKANTPSSRLVVDTRDKTQAEMENLIDMTTIEGNTTRIDNSGVLHLTDAQTYQQGRAVVNNDSLLNSGGMAGFTIECEALVGGGTQADGMSINFGDTTAINENVELGTQAGFAISIDTYDNPTSHFPEGLLPPDHDDYVGITLRYNGYAITTVPLSDIRTEEFKKIKLEVVDNNPRVPLSNRRIIHLPNNGQEYGGYTETHFSIPNYDDPNVVEVINFEWYQELTHDHTESILFSKVRNNDRVGDYDNNDDELFDHDLWMVFDIESGDGVEIIYQTASNPSGKARFGISDGDLDAIFHDRPGQFHKDSAHDMKVSYDQETKKAKFFINDTLITTLTDVHPPPDEGSLYLHDRGKDGGAQSFDMYHAAYVKDQDSDVEIFFTVGDDLVLNGEADGAVLNNWIMPPGSKYWIGARTGSKTDKHWVRDLHITELPASKAFGHEIYNLSVHQVTEETAHYANTEQDLLEIEIDKASIFEEEFVDLILGEPVVVDNVRLLTFADFQVEDLDDDVGDARFLENYVFFVTENDSSSGQIEKKNRLTDRWEAVVPHDIVTEYHEAISDGRDPSPTLRPVSKAMFTKEDLDEGRVRFRSKGTKFNAKNSNTEDRLNTEISFRVYESQDRINSVETILSRTDMPFPFPDVENIGVAANLGISDVKTLSVAVEQPPVVTTYPADPAFVGTNNAFAGDSNAAIPFIPIRSHTDAIATPQKWPIPANISEMGALSSSLDGHAAFPPEKLFYETYIRESGWKITKLTDPANEIYERVSTFTQADINNGVIFLERATPFNSKQEDNLGILYPDPSDPDPEASKANATLYNVFDFRVRVKGDSGESYNVERTAFPRTYQAKLVLDQEHLVQTASNSFSTNVKIKIDRDSIDNREGDWSVPTNLKSLFGQYANTNSALAYEERGQFGNFTDQDENDEVITAIDGQFDNVYEFYIDDIETIQGGVLQINRGSSETPDWQAITAFDSPAFTSKELDQDKIRFLPLLDETSFDIDLADPQNPETGFSVRIREQADPVDLKTNSKEVILSLMDATHGSPPMTITIGDPPQVNMNAPDEKLNLQGLLDVSRSGAGSSQIHYSVLPNNMWKMYEVTGGDSYTELPNPPTESNVVEFTQADIDAGNIAIAYQGGHQFEREAFKFITHHTPSGGDRELTVARPFFADIVQNELGYNQFVPPVQFRELLPGSTNELLRTAFTEADLTEETQFNPDEGMIGNEQFSSNQDTLLLLDKTSEFVQSPPTKEGFSATFDLFINPNDASSGTFSFNLGNPAESTSGHATEGLSVVFESTGNKTGKATFYYGAQTDQSEAYSVDFDLDPFIASDIPADPSEAVFVPIDIQVERETLDSSQLMVAVRVGDQFLTRRRIDNWSPQEEWQYFYQTNNVSNSPFTVDNAVISEYQVQKPRQNFLGGSYQVQSGSEAEKQALHLLFELWDLHHSPERWQDEEQYPVFVATPERVGNFGDNFIPTARYERRVQLPLGEGSEFRDKLENVQKEAIAFVHSSLYRLIDQLASLKEEISEKITALEGEITTAQSEGNPFTELESEKAKLENLHTSLSTLLDLSEFDNVSDPTSLDLEQQWHQLAQWYNSGLAELSSTEISSPILSDKIGNFDLREQLKNSLADLITTFKGKELREWQPQQSIYYYENEKERKENVIEQPFETARLHIKNSNESLLTKEQESTLVDRLTTVAGRREITNTLLKMSLDLWDLYTHPQAITNRQSLPLNTVKTDSLFLPTESDESRQYLILEENQNHEEVGDRILPLSTPSEGANKFSMEFNLDFGKGQLKATPPSELGSLISSNINKGDYLAVAISNQSEMVTMPDAGTFNYEDPNFSGLMLLFHPEVHQMGSSTGDGVDRQAMRVRVKLNGKDQDAAETGREIVFPYTLPDNFALLDSHSIPVKIEIEQLEGEKENIFIEINGQRIFSLQREKKDDDSDNRLFSAPFSQQQPQIGFIPQRTQTHLNKGEWIARDLSIQTHQDNEKALPHQQEERIKAIVDIRNKLNQFLRVNSDDELHFNTAIEQLLLPNNYRASSAYPSNPFVDIVLHPEDDVTIYPDFDPTQSANAAKDPFSAHTITDWYYDQEFGENLKVLIEQLIEASESSSDVEFVKHFSVANNAAKEYIGGGVELLNLTLSHLTEESYISRQTIRLLASLEGFLNQNATHYGSTQDLNLSIKRKPHTQQEIAAHSEEEVADGRAATSHILFDPAIAALSERDYLSIFELKESIYEKELFEVHRELKNMIDRGVGSQQQLQDAFNAISDIKKQLDWSLAVDWRKIIDTLKGADSSFDIANLETTDQWTARINSGDWSWVLDNTAEWMDSNKTVWETTDQFQEELTDWISTGLGSNELVFFSKAMADFAQYTDDNLENPTEYRKQSIITRYARYHQVISHFYGEYNEKANNYVKDDGSLGHYEGFVLSQSNRNLVEEATTKSSILNEMTKQKTKRSSFLYEEFIRSATSIIRKIRESTKSVSKKF